MTVNIAKMSSKRTIEDRFEEHSICFSLSKVFRKGCFGALKIVEVTTFFVPCKFQVEDFKLSLLKMLIMLEVKQDTLQKNPSRIKISWLGNETNKHT